MDYFSREAASFSSSSYLSPSISLCNESPDILACLFPLEEENYSDIPNYFLPLLEDTSMDIPACFLPVEDDETSLISPSEDLCDEITHRLFYVQAHQEALQHDANSTHIHATRAYMDHASAAHLTMQPELTWIMLIFHPHRPLHVAAAVAGLTQSHIYDGRRSNVQASDSLLKFVSEQKQTTIFLGFASLNENVKRRIGEFNWLEQSTDRLLERVGGEVAASLKVLETHYYSSQKTTGAFHDQSIDQLNDVTAVSGVNLRISQAYYERLREQKIQTASI
ncbi:Mediator of RNA polymerase II transcription subunit 22a [Platanthera zijinensis]|uniref:Mediator of RNA polymerase II transcription subunit 22a n=1 Tax=Platanthera zijinensis TaxID=2320716 RepID=A0AAP0B764_9ASPA